MPVKKTVGWLSVALFMVPLFVSAAELGRRGKKEYMGSCSLFNPGEHYVITNGSDAASCSSAQTVGTVPVNCMCSSADGVTFAWAVSGASPDLSGYAALSGADFTGSVSLTGGAVNFTANTDSQLTVTGVDGAQLVAGATDSTSAATSLTVVAGTAGDGGAAYMRADGVTVLSLADNLVRVVFGQVAPTTAADECVTGSMIFTSTFIYYCPSTDTWVRAALSTWP